MAPDRATAETAMATFVKKYAIKYAKAVECLTKDRAALLAFYDFPAEHWDHIRPAIPSRACSPPSYTEPSEPRARSRRTPPS
jgi:transposase-like protein